MEDGTGHDLSDVLDLLVVILVPSLVEPRLVLIQDLHQLGCVREMVEGRERGRGGERERESKNCYCTQRINEWYILGYTEKIETYLCCYKNAQLYLSPAPFWWERAK